MCQLIRSCPRKGAPRLGRALACWLCDTGQAASPSEPHFPHWGRSAPARQQDTMGAECPQSPAQDRPWEVPAPYARCPSALPVPFISTWGLGFAFSSWDPKTGGLGMQKPGQGGPLLVLGSTLGQGRLGAGLCGHPTFLQPPPGPAAHGTPSTTHRPHTLPLMPVLGAQELRIREPAWGTPGPGGRGGGTDRSSGSRAWPVFSGPGQHPSPLPLWGQRPVLMVSAPSAEGEIYLQLSLCQLARACNPAEGPRAGTQRSHRLAPVGRHTCCWPFTSAPAHLSRGQEG